MRGVGPGAYPEDLHSAGFAHGLAFTLATRPARSIQCRSLPLLSLHARSCCDSLLLLRAPAPPPPPSPHPQFTNTFPFITAHTPPPFPPSPSPRGPHADLPSRAGRRGRVRVLRETDARHALQRAKLLRRVRQRGRDDERRRELAVFLPGALSPCFACVAFVRSFVLLFVRGCGWLSTACGCGWFSTACRRAHVSRW